MTSPTDPIEVILHPVLIEPLRQWLDARGLDLRQVSSRTDEHLAQYVADPRMIPDKHLPTCDLLVGKGLRKCSCPVGDAAETS